MPAKEKKLTPKIRAQRAVRTFQEVHCLGQIWGVMGHTEFGREIHSAAGAVVHAATNPKFSADLETLLTKAEADWWGRHDQYDLEEEV